MATDMVGFTVLMGADPENALELVGRAHRILKDIVGRHAGEWLEDAGDRSFSAFPSAINAVECALEIQSALADEPELKLRIGVDIGDIVIADRHVYGDAVNVVSFIERLADPEGLVITEAVYEAVRPHIDLNVIDMGDKMLKNVDHSVRLYALSGRTQRSQLRNFLSALMTRRVPHIAGAYLAAGWGVVEVTQWLAGNEVIDPRWIYAVFVGLLALIPSVLLVTYLHGAHGADRLRKVEMIAVPLNVLFAALLVGFVYRTAELPQTGEPIDAASVAVLPFVNMSEDRGNDYFSRGLSEELINALAKVPGLYVASRTSSFLFDGQNEDPRDIARKLRVATILEGSVRKQGNRVKVTAQLIDGLNNYHLWTETYERELADIFEIQEQIARAVASELVGVLKPTTITVFAEARAATVGAYDFYLRGLSYLRAPPTERSLNSARDLFRRALAEDASYAQAYAGLCEVALEQYELMKSPAFIDEAESNCLRALELNNDMREVRHALGVLYRETGEFEESARIFRDILDDQPIAKAWVGLGDTNAAQGNFESAEISFKKAIDSEPGNWQNRMALAEFLYWRGRYDEAIEVLYRVIELSPDNARAYLLIGAAEDYLGNTEASLEATLKSISLSPTRAAYRDLGLTYYYEGDYAAAREAYQKAVELGPDDHWSWASLASVQRRLGDAEASQRAYEKAAELAEDVLERNERDWVTLATLAMYNVMRGDTETGNEQIRIAVTDGAHLDEVHYYDAIIHMHLDRPGRAIESLRRAVARGFPKRLIARDPQFAALKRDERFNAIIDEQGEKN